MKQKKRREKTGFIFKYDQMKDLVFSNREMLTNEEMFSNAAPREKVKCAL
jgi:hypothetical protein